LRTKEDLSMRNWLNGKGLELDSKDKDDVGSTVVIDKLFPKEKKKKNT